MPANARKSASPHVLTRLGDLGDFDGLSGPRLALETGKRIADNASAALAAGDLGPEDAWLLLCQQRHVPPFADLLLKGFVLALAEQAAKTPTLNLILKEA